MAILRPRMAEASQRLAAATPRPRKRFSLTRARPSADKLARVDRWRAATFAASIRGIAWALGASMRLRTTGESDLASHRRLGPGSLLFALWHGDFFPICHYGRGHGISVVVSRSPDGEILDRVLRVYGYTTVRGSNTRGATRAVIDLARSVEGGHDAAVAVDGPKGPAFEVKSGIVLLAKLTGCPIVPLGAGFSRCKQFASWDEFRVPFPWARVVLTAGSPIQVPANTHGEEFKPIRRRLERTLLDLREEAASLVQQENFECTRKPLGFAVHARSG